MKKQLFLLIIFGLGIYFYKKKSTDNLLIILTLALFLIMFGFDFIKEHNTNTSTCGCNIESIQSLASMYKNSTLTGTNLVIDGDLTVNGQVKGNLNVEEKITSKNLDVAENGTIQELNVNGNIILGGASVIQKPIIYTEAQKSAFRFSGITPPENGCVRWEGC
jgi:hypothetical protein